MFFYLLSRVVDVSELGSMAATKRIFSGIQPTGVPHLGNYLGAIKSWLSLQTQADNVLFSIVDLHALTVPKDPTTLKEDIETTAISLLSCGLDPDKCVIFQQSKVRIPTQPPHPATTPLPDCRE